MLEVAENSEAVQVPEYFEVELPFSFVGQMVNRKAGDYGVEAP